MHVPAARALRFAALLAVGLAATAVQPPPAAASCLPPDVRSLSGAPDAVVVAGHVIEVRDDEIDFDVQLYWGPDPRRVVTISRPEVDPTVISSTDWNPQPGEPWIVIATRDGERLRTETCMQLPGTREAEAQVRSSLGEPVRPAVDAEPGAAASDGGAAAESPGASAPASPAGGGAARTAAPGDASQAGATSPVAPILAVAALVLVAVVGLGLLLRRRTAG